jgi:hypothetical protein
MISTVKNLEKRKMIRDEKTNQLLPGVVNRNGSDCK